MGGCMNEHINCHIYFVICYVYNHPVPKKAWLEKYGPCAIGLDDKFNITPCGFTGHSRSRWRVKYGCTSRLPIISRVSGPVKHFCLLTIFLETEYECLWCSTLSKDFCPSLKLHISWATAPTIFMMNFARSFRNRLRRSCCVSDTHCNRLEEMQRKWHRFRLSQYI